MNKDIKIITEDGYLPQTLYRTLEKGITDNNTQYVKRKAILPITSASLVQTSSGQSVQEIFNKFKVGGRNYFLTITGNDNITCTNNDVYLNFTSHLDLYLYIYLSEPILKRGETYTLSFDVSGIADNNSYPFGICGSGYNIFYVKNGHNTACFTYTNSNDDNENNDRFILDNTGALWIPSPESTNVRFYNFKVEEGNIATSYTLPIESYIKKSNKPTGTYIGNGDITKREIYIQGEGYILTIFSSNRMCMVTPGGILGVYNNNIIGSQDVLYDNNTKILSIQTDNSIINESGITYYYQLL